MKPWVDAWIRILDLPEGVPEWLLATIIISFIFGFVILPSGALMSFFERKVVADFQARVGPNRAGPAGFFQSFADGLKLLQKDRSERLGWTEELWLAVHTMALYSTVAVLPMGSLTLLVNSDMSAFLPFWAALVLSFGTMLLGLNQGTVPGWFGGVRIAAQALAGALPALIGLICVGIRSGDFSWGVIVSSQSAWPVHWNAFSSPFEFIAFIVFVCGGLVLMGLAPLDGCVSIADIQGGVSAHLRGRRLSLFRLGRFYGLFLWSMIAAVLFLGGWNLPVSLRETLLDGNMYLGLQLLETLVLLLKTFFLMMIIAWVASVNPRLRTDQITDFSWKVLSPMALLALVGTTTWCILIRSGVLH